MPLHCISPLFVFTALKSSLQQILLQAQDDIWQQWGTYLPCGQLLERCDNSIFCWKAKCMLLNVKYLQKQLEKWSHRKSCLLPYSFLSCTENTTLFDHVVQNINSISTLDRFTLSLTISITIFLPFIFLPTSSTQESPEEDLPEQLSNWERVLLQWIQDYNKL